MSSTLAIASVGQRKSKIRVIFCLKVWKSRASLFPIHIFSTILSLSWDLWLANYVPVVWEHHCSICVHISDTDLIEILLVTELLLDVVMQSIRDAAVCDLRQLVHCVPICFALGTITHFNDINMRVDQIRKRVRPELIPIQPQYPYPVLDRRIFTVYPMIIVMYLFFYL